MRSYFKKNDGLRLKPSVPRSTAVSALLLVAALGFILGTKADDYAVFDSLFSSASEEEDLPGNLSYDSVEELYDTLRSAYDGPLQQQQLMDGIKKGLAEASQDPYTTYLNAEQVAQFEQDLNGTFSGIGAEIGKKNDLIIIVAPLKGYPADLSGLRPEDIVLEIDGQQTIGYTVDEAVLAIRGQKGTLVDLTILRNGQKLDFEIIRDDIVVPSVEYEMLAGNIGYLSVSRFAEDTIRLASEAAQDFINQGAEGVVLDLRNNSGGYLQAAVELCGLWLDNQIVVEQRQNDGQDVTEALRSSGKTPLAGTPTVVLINEGSASASEIVAGALRDYDIVTLVGTTTYGKGSVQALENLRSGGVLKVTIARWYTPLGDNIDQTGIDPDIVVEMSESDYENDTDPQLDRAMEILGL